MDTTKLNVSSVSEIITKSADFLSPNVSSSSSSSLIRSLSSLISKGASLAPHEIRIDFAVFPVATCQGLFNQNHLFFVRFSPKLPQHYSCKFVLHCFSCIFIEVNNNLISGLSNLLYRLCSCSLFISFFLHIFSFLCNKK